MYEQNNTPSDESTAHKRDAIDVGDFVFAATGSRLRRLTTPAGEHWFVAADVAGNLGYTNTRQALILHVAAEWQTTLGDLAQGVYGADASRRITGPGLKKSMKVVNLKGLISLVNGCTKPECEPFKTWVADVIATIQRDGSYSLEPAPVQPAPAGGTAYVMPQQVVDAIVRLEERNIRTNDMLKDISHSLRDIADALRAPRATRPRPAPDLTPPDLLAAWKRKNLVVTEDVHAVAACLAPALVRGEASYRVEEIAGRTGLPLDRVHDCLRMLLKRGCVRQVGCAADGAPVYVLP
ncbi:BRO-N domain-containing protein [Streptomyces sp. NPDC001595]|uniref:BRO-N domain-containing protein n=1 Tax=Streptomyces sp. NPDC001532 TaxID=3154520 RepID=UPI00332B4F4C